MPSHHKFRKATWRRPSTYTGRKHQFRLLSEDQAFFSPIRLIRLAGPLCQLYTDKEAGQKTLSTTVSLWLSHKSYKTECLRQCFLNSCHLQGHPSHNFRRLNRRPEVHGFSRMAKSRCLDRLREGRPEACTRRIRCLEDPPGHRFLGGRHEHRTILSPALVRFQVRLMICGQTHTRITTLWSRWNLGETAAPSSVAHACAFRKAGCTLIHVSSPRILILHEPGAFLLGDWSLLSAQRVLLGPTSRGKHAAPRTLRSTSSTRLQSPRTSG